MMEKKIAKSDDSRMKRFIYRRGVLLESCSRSIRWRVWMMER